VSTVVEEKTERKTGKKYRIIVRSADEAVRVIQRKLGPEARVISVRQVGGQGLAKFISSPKLEVIAEIPPEGGELGNEVLDSSESLSANEVDVVPESQATDIAAPNPDMPEGASSLSEEDLNDSDVMRLLGRAGFDPALLSDLRAWARWDEMKEMPLADALKEITVGLSDRYRDLDNQGTSNRIALIGPPGVGKTTTLCKFLAHEVFINKHVPHVLKVENGVPNPDDALRIFCEVVGVTLYREPTNIPQVSDESPLYLDFPGISLSHREDWTQTRETLDLLDVETRVLVVNAAYDRAVIDQVIRLSSLLGATHLALTHFDELSNSTKLWPVVLRSGLTPLCVCHGQNVTGDFSTNVLNQLIARTFPEQLYARGISRRSA
jgi:flagellar biosynthesis protein FlhF